MLKLAAQTQAHLQKSNVDADHFIAWAREHERQRFTAAALTHAFSGNVGAYDDLAEIYLRKVSPEASEIAAGGYETWTAKDGTRMVRIKGQVTTVAAATRMGLL